jgi:hypothetical protein
MRLITKPHRFALVICLMALCAFSPYVPAQDATGKPTRLEAAAKFDEYGQLRGCDHSARLDNFAVSLQNDPGLDGYILIYGPQGDGWGGGKSQFSVIKDYLVNSRGLVEDRIKFVYGGRNNNLREPKIELWLAPQGAGPPEPQHFETEIKTFKGKFAEWPAWDDISVILTEEGEGPGLPVADATLASFADMLQQQKETTAYVVAYNGPDAVPGAWRRVAEKNVSRLKTQGVESDRIKLIFGGNDKATKVQLWILPNGAPAPAINVGSEALPQKAVQMGSFTDYELGTEENEASVFKDLVKVLRVNDKLRACLIVRLESLGATEEETAETDASNEMPESAATSATNEEQEESSPSDEGRPPAGFPKLVQKWTVKLAEEKIQPDRLIVLFVPVRDWRGNSMEAWIVPAGLPLPDPFAPDPEPPKDTEDPPQNSDRIQPAKPAK